ncbi:hypothetical protein R6Q59_027111 [Mikania micrantha]
MVELRRWSGDGGASVVDVNLWKLMGDFNLHGITAPEEYGGLGLGYFLRLLILHVRNRTAAQKEKYLPKFTRTKKMLNDYNSIRYEEIKEKSCDIGLACPRASTLPTPPHAQTNTPVCLRPYECNEKKTVFRSEKGGKPNHFHSHFRWKAVRDTRPTIIFLRQTLWLYTLLQGKWNRSIGHWTLVT